jgi:hypothetical protein
MSKTSIALGLSLLMLLPTAALAQGGINPVNLPDSPNTVLNVINNIMNFLFGLLLVIAALFILYAAYLYLTSGGDEEQTKKARQYIIYAVVAIIVGFLARAIVALTKTVLGI